MKTLLIDNHDSCTYHLFQLITEVNGEEPVVILNDTPHDALPDLAEFDNVVVSPGAGHPAEPRDVGIGTKVIARSRIPVLGVCLGHQGIAVGEQGRVEPASQPRHGYLSTVRHDGQDLFRGLPQDFTAVRSHSLSVAEPLPATLRATAWAEDGVVMALRHLARPLWGVQFHPESVLTDHGHRMLMNFRNLTAERARKPRTKNTTIPPSAAAVPRPRRAARRPAHRLHYRRLAGAVDTEAAFTRMCASAPRAFWLDSSRAEPGLARFSFFGDGTGPLTEFVRYDVDAGVCEVERPGRPVRKVRASVFDHLKRQLATRRVDATGLPFDFTGGYVGYFGYETKADRGSPNRHRSRTPDACWLFADRLIAVDHEEDCTYAVCVAEDTPQATREAADWLDGAMAQLTRVASSGPGDPAPDGPEPGTAEPWLVRDRAAHLADIEACGRELSAGDSYEICPTNAARLPAPGDSFGFYRTLRRADPAPHAAFLKFGELDVAGSSPECFLRITRDGIAEAEPVKGDLGRVRETGSIRVTRPMATETQATVHQLVSTVEGRLREDTDVVDCVRACFPGGSTTGAPKLRAMEIIDCLETEARGVCSGALGYFGCGGGTDLGTVIRTAVIADGRMHLGAGGAIVLGSDPAAEFDEMLLKTAAVMRAHREYTAAPAAQGEPAR